MVFAGVVSCISSVWAFATAAEPLAFDGSWKEVGFLRLSSNDYLQTGTGLGIASDGTVSLLWKPLDKSHWDATQATWSWRVSQGVVPTDLTKKGGDDRNLALYFIFADRARADTLRTSNARRVLREDSTRAIIYVWGGDHAVGQDLASPYSPRMRTKILQVAMTGSFDESIDLAQDYRRMFGTAPGALVGVAVSADSDDTDGRIVANLSDLTLRKPAQADSSAP